MLVPASHDSPACGGQSVGPLASGLRLPQTESVLSRLSPDDIRERLDKASASGTNAVPPRIHLPHLRRGPPQPTHQRSFHRPTRLPEQAPESFGIPETRLHSHQYSTERMRSSGVRARFAEPLSKHFRIT